MNKNSQINEKNILTFENNTSKKNNRRSMFKNYSNRRNHLNEEKKKCISKKNKSNVFYIGNYPEIIRKKTNFHKNMNVLYAENYKINLTDKPVIDDVPRNVKGRLNEWVSEFDENNTLGFFPILLEEMSNEPSPLQIGFEDYMQFNGEQVEEIFKNMIREININGEKKKNIWYVLF